MQPDNIVWEIAQKYKYQVLLVLTGIILIGLGVVFTNVSLFSSPEIQVIEDSQENDGVLVVEVSGSVNNPSVYSLPQGSRIEDALTAAGGLSDNADSEWIERFINRAAKVEDGQKIYIPSVDNQSDTGSANIYGGSNATSNVNGSVASTAIYYVNVNTASQSELESLWGIGPVTAQNIIEQRPYSSVEELLDKKIIKNNVYERNKDKLSVY